MKLIEALKQTKDLTRKADDIKALVKSHCAISSLETQKYLDQTKQVSIWIQAYCDVLKEILRLRIAIQKTNLETEVTIKIDEKNVTKSIAAWIHRRRDLAAFELQIWQVLSDRGIHEGFGKSPTGDPIEIKVNRFYSPAEKDKKMEVYISEPSIIDGKLEVVNAITDLIEN
ncbi:hypothetical protein KAW50_06560 [candidate division WOR-3 bacterium]|nr:hypothetical protein [candidate division WOR-3 bacterium]